MCIRDRNNGWLSKNSMEKVAETLSMSYIRVLEVATFYSMFNLEPIGKNFVQICRTTPCWLRGSDKLSKVAQEVCETNIGETSDDEIFTVVEVECLGACCNAPMVQINDDYYEDLDEESFKKILQDLKFSSGTLTIGNIEIFNLLISKLDIPKRWKLRSVSYTHLTLPTKA